MQEMTWETLITVLEEMFGTGLFWTIAIAIVIVMLAYIYVLIRDRTISMHKFVLAQISMPIGAIIAIWFVMFSTDSSLRDMGGPIDYITLLAIAIFGAIGCAILVYTIQSLIKPPIRK